jgi:hypothetical protein
MVTTGLRRSPQNFFPPLKLSNSGEDFPSLAMDVSGRAKVLSGLEMLARAGTFGLGAFPVQPSDSEERGHPLDIPSGGWTKGVPAR